jgi:hypothetical protein
MDQEMTQMLAQRLGLTGEQRDAIQSGDLSSLISAAAGNSQNPLMLALTASLLEQSLPDTEATARQYEHKLERAKRIIRELRRDLAGADEILNYIARVLGACSACLGQNRFCPRCRGDGRPGSAAPPEVELLDWVEPALRRLGLRVVRTEQASGRTSNLDFKGE